MLGILRALLRRACLRYVPCISFPRRSGQGRGHANVGQLRMLFQKIHSARNYCLSLLRRKKMMVILEMMNQMTHTTATWREG